MLRKRIGLFCVTAVVMLGGACLTSAEETAPQTIVIRPEGKDPVTVVNTAGLDILGVSTALNEEDETLADITLAAKDGTQYEFKNVSYADMQDPELIVEGAFAYLNYMGIASGKERKVGQTGELEYSESAELFAIDDVYIRSEPDSEAEILGVISRGDAIEVLGETASHYKVKKEDVVGYTVRRCISEDEQEALAAVQAEEAAREQIRAAAAAAAAAQQSSGGSSSKSKKKHEVSRQKFEDCDGSGHGYYLITYSDGSTKTKDF